MKFLSVFAVIALLLSPASARDFRPEGRMENIPLADSSIQQCYIFKTTAGVRYTVESSEDLSNWTTQDEIYGLGNEYAVTMREFTPPPPPPPGTPPAVRPPPPINVSLRLQRASGAAGGTVVAWPSPDHGGPVVVRTSGEMDPGWDRIPLFWDHYDAYSFFVWHPNNAVAPPAENSILGTKDSAMLVMLEASLPAMNQQVADSAARARNAPPPAPEVPGSKRFWRVKVDPDVDTDSDGSPDWSEFEIAARGAGSLVAGVIGDPFDPDSNGDGIPDGDQLDADLDNTPDAKDPDSTDNTATFPLGPLPRYALFPITNAQPPTGWENPWQISGKGTVLCNNGTWTGGSWKPLLLESGNLKDCQARSINDHNVILGSGTLKVQVGNDITCQQRVCYWPDPAAAPATLSATGTATEGEVFPSTSWDLSYGDLRYGQVLSNDGKFLCSQPTMPTDCRTPTSAPACGPCQLTTTPPRKFPRLMGCATIRRPDSNGDSRSPRSNPTDHPTGPFHSKERSTRRDCRRSCRSTRKTSWPVRTALSSPCRIRVSAKRPWRS